MERARFFASLRSSGLFPGGLSEPNVAGTEAILDACDKRGVVDIRQVAHALAEVYHETGGYMSPIKETVYASHKDKNPSDATVIARLNKAWKAGKLGTVKVPYWLEGWFGRGQIQITHRDNYQKLGRRIGVDLLKEPAKTLELEISADIAVVGMKEGLFRFGHTLDRYFSATANDPVGARAIVNGDVKTNGKRIAGHHQHFLLALRAGGYGQTVVSEKPTPSPKPASAPRPLPSEPVARDCVGAPKPASGQPEPKRGILAIIFEIIWKLLRGNS